MSSYYRFGTKAIVPGGWGPAGEQGTEDSLPWCQSSPLALCPWMAARDICKGHRPGAWTNDGLSNLPAEFPSNERYDGESKSDPGLGPGIPNFLSGSSKLCFLRICSNFLSHSANLSSNMLNESADMKSSLGICSKSPIDNL